MSQKEPEFQTYVSIKPSPEMMAKIHSVIEEYCKKEFPKIVKKIMERKLKEVINEYLEEREKLTEKGTLRLRRISRKNAITRIKEYISKHPGCRTSDIIYDLALDPDLVISILTELEDKGNVSSEDL